MRQEGTLLQRQHRLAKSKIARCIEGGYPTCSKSTFSVTSPKSSTPTPVIAGPARPAAKVLSDNVPLGQFKAYILRCGFRRIGFDQGTVLSAADHRLGGNDFTFPWPFRHSSSRVPKDFFRRRHCVVSGRPPLGTNANALTCYEPCGLRSRDKTREAS